MLRSQTLQIEANDINTKLIALRAKLRDGNVEMRADDGTETEAYKAWQTETSGLEDTLKTTLSRQHEAFESEDREIEARRDAGDTGGWDSEQREFIKIESRASMADYLARSLSDHEGQLRGPTAELDQALRGAEAITYDNIIPWALMLEPEKLKEVRALGTPSSVQGMQDPIIREVFAASTAAFLGTRYSSVGIGDALVPVLTAAVAAIEPKDDLIAAGGSIAVTTLTPKRFGGALRDRASGHDARPRARGHRPGRHASERHEPARPGDHPGRGLGVGDGRHPQRGHRADEPDCDGHMADRPGPDCRRHRRQVCPEPESAQVGRRDRSDGVRVRARGDQHGGATGGLPDARVRRPHVHQQHAEHGDAAPGPDLQVRSRHDVQRRRQDVGWRPSGHPRREDAEREGRGRHHRRGLLRLLGCSHGWLFPHEHPHVGSGRTEPPPPADE